MKMSGSTSNRWSLVGVGGVLIISSGKSSINLLSKFKHGHPSFPRNR